MAEEKRIAMIAGATGLVGSYLIQYLSADPFYQKIISLVRRPSGLSLPKVQEKILDFEELENALADEPADHIFCCLGTTMKKAGSKDKFHTVDFQYPYRLAKFMKSKGAAQYNLVSALGANQKSMFFYNRVKGQAESEIAQLNFDQFNAFRPSLLLGERQEQRKGEQLATTMSEFFSPAMLGPLRKYRGIEARTVAKAMLQVAKAEKPGYKIIESDLIQQIASSKFFPSEKIATV
jgi:uncharacterized protein YbjT (DUF2867 family)